MAEILTHVFRTFMSPTDPKRDLAVGPSPPTCGTLVIGEPSLSRSVLLLAAVTAASQTGMKVMFFAQTQIQSLPASLQKRVPSLSLEALKVTVTLLSSCVTYLFLGVLNKRLDDFN